MTCTHCEDKGGVSECNECGKCASCGQYRYHDPACQLGQTVFTSTAALARVIAEMNKAHRALQASEDFHAAIRQTCKARGFTGTWTDDAVTALAEAYDRVTAERDGSDALLADLARLLDEAGTDKSLGLVERLGRMMAERDGLRAVVAEVKKEAERLAAAECDDSMDPRVDPSAAYAEATNSAGEAILALLPREG